MNEKLKSILTAAGILHALAMFLKMFNRAALQRGEDVANYSTGSAMTHILSGRNECLDVIDKTIAELQMVREQVAALDDPAADGTVPDTVIVETEPAVAAVGSPPAAAVAEPGKTDQPAVSPPAAASDPFAAEEPDKVEEPTAVDTTPAKADAPAATQTSATVATPDKQEPAASPAAETEDVTTDATPDPATLEPATPATEPAKADEPAADDPKPAKKKPAADARWGSSN